jgi:hypothetical protein
VGLCVVVLGLGSLASACFKTDFLMGAVCKRDAACGGDGELCCSGERCRPAPCERGESEDTSYDKAYSPCDVDEECHVYGIPRCVHREGADRGFCADLCEGIADNCEKHPDSHDRVCVDVDGQPLCALRCCSAGCVGDTEDMACLGQEDCPAPCPTDMECLDDVCVPTKTSS